MKIQDFQDNVTCGGFDNIFANIYKPQDIESQESRYMSAVEKFTALYPNRNDIHVYSAPGRTEIGGNHTDHQHGCVIAGAVDLDVIGVVAFHDENIIRIKSEGYDEFAVSLDDLDVHIGEKGSSEIVRGIAARFKDLGVEISGFDMYTTSNVLGGSGISSSAAFETLIATAIDSYYNPPPISESLKKIKQNAIDRQEIQKWVKRDIKIGETISATPTIEECKDFPYLLPLISAFNAWSTRNYGSLSVWFKNVFSYESSDKKRAGECRKLFDHKNLISYELEEIEERALALTKIVVLVKWKSNDIVHTEHFEFGCSYQQEDGNVGYPWKNNGAWILIPWKIQGKEAFARFVEQLG